MRATTGQPRRDGRSELSLALGACRGAFLGVALMTAAINILTLTGSFFMLEVYDRVLPSRSVPTLIGLSVLALALFAFQGALDVLRTRILSRIGASLDESVGARVFDVMTRLPLKTQAARDGGLPLRDLDQIRAFLSSMGPTALFDLPFMPVYLFICFLFHPAIGWAAVVGALLLISLTLLTEIKSREPAKRSMEHATARLALSEAARRNAEVLQALGMGGRIGAQWGVANDRFRASQQDAADVTGGLGAVTRVLRMVLQSAVLAVGAYLVIHGQASAGVIIASSILVARALSPVELAIANWRGFVSARQSWHRLNALLASLPERTDSLALPAPRHGISVEGVSAGPPGQPRVVVSEVAFQLRAGQGLGIIGPSASGKSSLARVIAGVWTPLRGKVRLDGASLDQWSPADLGRHMGYLPQDVELFAGTVAQNIARFDPDATSEAIIEAATEAGVHQMILRLPDGYETQIGEGGASLSAGQRQRLALARALFGNPFLVVLDEPNSNLDAEGEQALTQAMLKVRSRGGIVIVVAHRPAALAAVDQVLMMVDGRPQALGPKDEVLAKVTRPAKAPQRPAAAAAGGQAGPGLRVVAETQENAP